jgi:hypothetical protein
MSARRRCTRCRASLRRMPSRSLRSRSVGRLAKLLVEQAQQRPEGLSLPLCGVAVTSTRCGRVLPRSAAQLEALLPAAADAAGQRAAVGLVHDDELRALEDKSSARRGFDEVGGDDGEAVAVEHRHAHGRSRSSRWMVLLSTSSASMWNFSASSCCHCSARCGGHSTASRWISPGRAARGRSGRLDGLADADVVGDQQPHRVELERHHQRHELVGPRLDGDAAEAAERSGRRAGGQPRGVPQQPPGGEVAEVGRVGRETSLTRPARPGRMPVISSSSPPTGRTISSSSVDSGRTTHSRPRAWISVPGLDSGGAHVRTPKMSGCLRKISPVRLVVEADDDVARSMSRA